MLRKTLLAGAAAILLGFLFRDRLLKSVGTYLVDAADPQPADIALVLAGDGFGDRITAAAGLVKQGYAPKVVVSGPSGNYGLYECDMAIPFAVKAGFPESYFIHAENEARSTAEEAQAMLPVLARYGAKRVLLVTSDFHTRRAGRLFRAAAPSLEFTVVAAPSHDFRASDWWRSRQGQKIAFNEWTKTIASWFGI